VRKIGEAINSPALASNLFVLRLAEKEHVKYGNTGSHEIRKHKNTRKKIRGQVLLFAIGTRFGSRHQTISSWHRPTNSQGFMRLMMAGASLTP
jgi:hypothetical protein